jgi:general secretion pathway protein G
MHPEPYHPAPRVVGDARRCRGLTLLELMIAIAIVALLATLAFPALSSYRDRVRTASIVNDFSAIEIALNARRADAGQFPASLSEIGWTRLDPWGRPYEYLRLTSANRGLARKDRNLVPINTDFDLYSLGPDGRSAPPLTAAHSRDDVIRAANGRFVGTAADF